MDLAGKYLVVWLSPEAVETFLGVLEPSQEHAMTTWTVAGQVLGEAGPGLWVRSTRSRSTSSAGSWSRRRACTTRCRRMCGGSGDAKRTAQAA
jgi:hypothetical protein